ncbi:uncharacterized protein LOC100902133 [Galendromus occidentalis]|uniref:Uncharacterized protein LOC100902133 n=1 Tax=Galendromus occidentalis TaxID=34638 RepID=A0AAJ6QUK1_9ACAR|nr:uncharacterized protein LOC100902133 [Galendromus occidentalis]
MSNFLNRLQERRDWIFWFLSDPSESTFLQIFFRRFKEQLALVFVRLNINGRFLFLRETFCKDNSDERAYSAGGIRLECVAPMRRWRLAVNAMMEDLDGVKIHVRIGVQVAMVGHTFELPKQVKPSFLARRYESEGDERAKEKISRCCSGCQAISQPVSVFTEIITDGQRNELMLFGSRLKCFGNSDLLEDVPIYFGYAENGTTLTAINVQSKAYGYCCDPVKFVQSIRKTKCSLDKRDGPDRDVKLRFQVGDTKHKLLPDFDWNGGWTESSGKDHTSKYDGAGRLTTGGKDFKLQSALLQLFEKNIRPVGKLQLCRLLQFPTQDSDFLVLSVSEPSCKNPKLTGGKGASLAVLTELSNHFRTFKVPSAVVLTVKAYAVFAETPVVSRAIENFLIASKTAGMADLKVASDKCVSAISNADLPDLIRESLNEKLCGVFGELWKLRKFAVRSSAVGEDSEEMSAAGQMTTYLGVQGEEEVFSAVVKCWASQFALTAVNYKRQYGQDLESQMAVVVQEMVSADSAGVMFTCDPVTSNPTGISITANFGLGESVVSATADPDTFSFRRDGAEVFLIAKSRGVKDRMVVESESGSGTIETIVDLEKAKRFCLSNIRAIQIASIGALLTDVYDSPRDIEWAVVHGKVYLLQSRPVTSFLRESDFEIRHDFNSGLYTNREILSRANLDEVMPGAFSTLGISVCNHLVFELFGKQNAQWSMNDPSQYVFFQDACIGKKTYMNFSQSGFAGNENIMKMMEVTMFGYDVSAHDALKDGIVHPTKKPKGLGAVVAMLSALRDPVALAKRMHSEAELFRVNLPEEGDALSLFLRVLRHVPSLVHFMGGLMEASMPAGFYNVVTMNILKSSQHLDDFSPELMLLVSKLLRSDLEVESAQIPKELTSLSNLLREDRHFEAFIEMTPEDALKWLEEDGGAAATEFRAFRARNAHRSYKEFDLYSKTWGIDPLPLVRTLQSSARAPETNNSRKDGDSMTVDQLPLRPSLLQRALLKFLIPRTQRAVYAREATKSALIKSYHALRLAMRKVGQQLQAEGKIPDPELIFFLSCDEIYRLITTRDPSLIPRALRRRKMHSLLDQERYPVLILGMPKPIDASTITIDPNAQKIEGIPVSEGIVVGPARVILDFTTEAHLIKKGEILVTRATDTGWTPYFPLLGGVVTEVGGLLSHGAVVAREYGLPAIVGVAGVTSFVKSGDSVTLDGHKGILQKNVSSEEERTGSAEPFPAADIDANLTAGDDGTDNVALEQPAGSGKEQESSKDLSTTLRSALEREDDDGTGYDFEDTAHLISAKA